MLPAATDVQTAIISGVGHWVAEQAPDQVLEALSAFLASYRGDEAGSAELRAVAAG